MGVGCWCGVLVYSDGSVVVSAESSVVGKSVATKSVAIQGAATGAVENGLGVDEVLE